MNIQTTTLWCLKHLESLKEFFIALPHKWRFASLHRKLLAHRYNLLIRPDASFIETSCGMGELVNGLHASQKVGVDLSPGRGNDVVSQPRQPLNRTALVTTRVR